MKVGTLEATSGKKVFGSLQGPTTRGGFQAHIPLHIIRGRQDGPTLVVQAGVSGLEIEPSMELPHVVEAIDPATVSGTLVVVPLMNTSGFEFEQEKAVWDDKDLNRVGFGDPSGTVSEQLIHLYAQQVLSTADAIVDIHTGAKWGYFRYAGVYDTGAVDKSRALAVALGLPHVVLGQPEDASMAYHAARMGKMVVSAWIGGGPGLRDYREEDMRRVRLAVLNAMRHLGMMATPVERSDGAVAVIHVHTVLRNSGTRGLTFMAKEKRGTLVRTGERIGYVMHPFTGDIVEHITAPRDGVMVHGGAAWPVLPEGATLAILGDIVTQQ